MADVGQYIKDGAVTWLVTDVRDVAGAGDVRFYPYLKDGFVLANGAEVLRADYPRLIDFATKHNLWQDLNETTETFTVDTYSRIVSTFSSSSASYSQGQGKTSYIRPKSEDDWDKIAVGDIVVDNYGYLPEGTTVTAKPILKGCKMLTLSNAYQCAKNKDISSITVTHKESNYKPYLFGSGDGETTFVLPNYVGLFIQGGASLDYASAGLPNIEGTFLARAFAEYVSGNGLGTTEANTYGESEDITCGALYKNVETLTSIDGASGVSGSGSTYSMSFNASHANAIYGNSDTVQPPAITLLPQIKY